MPSYTITNNIRSLHSKKLAAPLIYLGIAAILWILLPLNGLFYPQKIESNSTMKQLTKESNSYLSITFPTLYFTGYTSTIGGKTSGYYYYALLDKQCLIVQLTPSTCEEGLPSISHCNVTGYLQKENDAFEQLITNMSNDLKWTDSGMKEQFGSYYLSEPSYSSWQTNFVRLFYIASCAYSVIYFLIHFIYACFPLLSPSCRKLGRFGRAKDLLMQAEDELATLPQLATEDMFITENFFIELAPTGVAIVPIQEIIWVYKHSTLHNFLWYHFVISYTLHITANNHFYIQCPKNIKSDIDGIMDYLAEANHNILVGFNEENRKKVQEIQNRSIHFERFIEFLKQRI